eukprot:5831464-Prymnesium_polylepis.1
MRLLLGHELLARPVEARVDGVAPRANARQRRSAERSARRHTPRRRPIRTAAHAWLFLIRL